jgi:hypothetical protein
MHFSFSDAIFGIFGEIRKLSPNKSLQKKIYLPQSFNTSFIIVSNANLIHFRIEYE